MKVFIRRWKQRVFWIASVAGLVLLIYNYSPIPTEVFLQRGRLWNGDERGVREPGNNLGLVSAGHNKQPFVNAANISALLIQKDANTTIDRRRDNLTESTNEKVPDVSFDVCKDARFSKAHTHPLIALTGVPGSGNTWLRYLIERASGFYTGSVYRDQRLHDGGFKGELVNHRSGKTVIIKTHDMGSSETTRIFEGAVVIVRNPYDTLLSYANLVAKGHTGWASRQYFNSQEWDTFVESASIAWKDRITTWVTRDNVMAVFYERLKSDLRRQITNILEFLDVPIDDARLDCTVAHPEGSFHRQKGESNRTFDPYTDKHKSIVKMHIKAVSKVLRETGYIDNDLSYVGLSKLI
ncbi:WSC domain-containing protein 1 [Strongylocentrotus purpuratus]|uniref:Sulfotransferase domain-containing protein n=1 Tax=Strongylocentrotus purpuratus TaxID=7668 RepID=A0A7M7N5M8_STRPU|nr:WSC domain-containing protein 1 [Strongylocentrotus purpuratus]